MAVNIINTHAKPSTSFFNIFEYKDRMSLTFKMDGEKRKRLAKKCRQGRNGNVQWDLYV